MTLSYFDATIWLRSCKHRTRPMPAFSAEFKLRNGSAVQRGLCSIDCFDMFFYPITVYTNYVQSRNGEYMGNLTEKTTAALGLTLKTVGKTQARKEFFPLVDSLCSANSAVEITDHDEPVAVLLSYQNYVALTVKACAHVGSVKPQSPNLIGSLIITSDLDAASEKIAGMFKVSLDESAGKL